MSLYTTMVSMYMSLSIPLNIWMVIRCLSMTEHRVKHVLLASFAADNLLQSTLGQGLQIAASGGSVDTSVCSWARFSTWLTATGSIVHFAFLSIERYLESTNSNKLDVLLRKCFFLPPILWAYSAFWCCLPILGLGDYSKFGVFYPGCNVIETGTWRAVDLIQFLLMVVLGFVLPLILSVVYQMLSYRTQNLCNVTSIISLTYGDKNFFKRQKKHQQLNLVCVAIITIYFVLWAPYLSCLLYFIVTHTKVKSFQLAAPLIRELCVLLPSLVYWYWYVHYHSFAPLWVTNMVNRWKKPKGEPEPTVRANSLLVQRTDDMKVSDLE